MSKRNRITATDNEISFEQPDLDIWTDDGAWFDVSRNGDQSVTVWMDSGKHVVLNKTETSALINFLLEDRN